MVSFLYKISAKWNLKVRLWFLIFVVFQINIISVSASTVNLGFARNNSISENYVQGEIESSSLVEIGLRRVLSKNEVGSELVDLLSGERSAAKGGTSLGAGRTAAKQWLQGAGNLERGTLIQNIESAGFKRMSPATSPVSVFERGGMRIRLDPPQSGTPFNHMHLEYGGNSYNTFLNPVNYRSPAAHIPIR